MTRRTSAAVLACLLLVGCNDSTGPTVPKSTGPAVGTAPPTPPPAQNAGGPKKGAKTNAPAVAD